MADKLKTYIPKDCPPLTQFEGKPEIEFQSGTRGILHSQYQIRGKAKNGMWAKETVNIWRDIDGKIKETRRNIHSFVSQPEGW